MFQERATPTKTETVAQAGNTNSMIDFKQLVVSYGLAKGQVTPNLLHSSQRPAFPKEDVSPGLQSTLASGTRVARIALACCACCPAYQYRQRTSTQQATGVGTPGNDPRLDALGEQGRMSKLNQESVPRRKQLLASKAVAQAPSYQSD